jgi:regulatory protein
MARPRARLSLKGRALQLLAQRDQSRTELRAKLLRHAAAEARARAAAAAIEPVTAGESEDPGEDGERLLAEVEALLDWLEAHQYLSAERFAESRVHARQARFGNRRIRAELAQHGVALSPEASQALAASELQRAAAVRERRFQEPPKNAAERAAQARFLAGRGFSPEVIQRVLRR